MSFLEELPDAFSKLVTTVAEHPDEAKYVAMALSLTAAGYGIGYRDGCEETRNYELRRG